MRLVEFGSLVLMIAGFYLPSLWRVFRYSALKQPPIPLNFYRFANAINLKSGMYWIDQDVAFVTSGDCTRLPGGPLTDWW